LRASGDLVVDFQLAIAGDKAGADPRPGQGEQPADVLRQDEVPGRSHQVRAEDGPLVEEAIELRIGCAAAPLPKCPLGSGVILRLYGGQGSDRVERGLERLTDKPLGLEASGCDVVHRGRSKRT
jgi:hypothetical protein